MKRRSQTLFDNPELRRGTGASFTAGLPNLPRPYLPGCISDTQVGQNDGSYIQQVVVVLADERFVVPNAFLKLLLHEEDVGDIPYMRSEILAQNEGGTTILNWKRAGCSYVRAHSFLPTWHLPCTKRAIVSPKPSRKKPLPCGPG